jgi:surface antigen
MAEMIAFIQKYLGLKDMGDDDQYASQCVRLIEKWLAANGKPLIGGNAIDLLFMANRSLYHVTMNTPSNYPPPGAVIVWHSTWGGGYGHTAVVVAANAMHVAVFEQNNPTGSLPIVATHDYSGVAGWITW